MAKLSEFDFERFFDLSLDLLCIAGLDGHFKHVNGRFQQLLGYSTAELLAQPFIEFVHPEDVAPTLRELDSLGRGSDTVYFENRYRCKDGSWKWLAWTCPAAKHDERLLYAAARDITWQKQAESELRIRDSILASMQHGLLITDPRLDDNPIIYCNDAFSQITGYDRDEVMGKNCRFLQNEDRNQEQLQVLRESIQEGQPCRVLLKNYRKDGQPFWNELTVSPVSNEDGSVTHFVGIQNDVSQIIHAKQARWSELSDRMHRLPRRQLEVLELLIAGKTTKSIARTLGISAKTVEVHRARLLKKMEVDSVVDLVRLVVGSKPS